VEYARARSSARRKRERSTTTSSRNGGDPTGERIADVDYQGNVHPTQFWQGYSLGNVRDRPFGEIWEDESNPLLEALRNREERLNGKCADCQYQSICRGASRLRALATTGDLFAPDPQCYLRDEEVRGGGGGLPAAALRIDRSRVTSSKTRYRDRFGGRRSVSDRRTRVRLRLRVRSRGKLSETLSTVRVTAVVLCLADPTGDRFIYRLRSCAHHRPY